MFFSETLLAKRGPLAHVWLAANLERKLSRNQFIRANIEESVEAIVGESEGPMALRLSGQLLLGVVRIYSRKAKYLMDDCNDTFLKLRVAFRPGGTVDMTTSSGGNGTSNSSGKNTGNALVLSNTITDLDLLLPDIPDLIGSQTAIVSSLDNQENISPRKAHKLSLEDITLPNYDQSIEIGRGLGDDDELMDNLEGGDLDLDLNLDVEGDVATGDNDQSIEIGRDRQGSMQEFDDFNFDIPMGNDGEGDVVLDKEIPSSPDLDQLNPLTPPGGELDGTVNIANLDDDIDLPVLQAEDIIDPTTIQPKKRRQPIKRAAKLDSEIELRGSYIRDIQANHDHILRQHPLLAEDPDYCTLQAKASRASEFAKTIYTPSGLPLSLAKMLDPKYVHQTIRRKRTTENEQRQQENNLDDEREMSLVISPHTPKSIRLDDNGDLSNDQEHMIDDSRYRDHGFMEDTALTDHYDNDGDRLSRDIFVEGEEEQALSSMDYNDKLARQENESVSQSGISENTLEAARILRDEFGLEKSEVNFSQLVNEHPGKQTKVKMFFEMLVLATKDAITLNQPQPYGEISISSKDQLYGPLLTRSNVTEDFINDNRVSV